MALFPLAVFVVGLVAVGIMVARAADQAELLRVELRRVGQLRPLLVEIGNEGRRLRATMAHARR